MGSAEFEHGSERTSSTNGLETIQRRIEEAAKKVAHATKSDRQKEMRQTLEEVIVKEGVLMPGNRL